MSMFDGRLSIRRILRARACRNRFVLFAFSRLSRMAF